MNIKRRHHYVWQNYLHAWERGDKLWCLRDKKIFNTGTIALGVERDFYETHNLSEIDIEFLRRVISREPDPELQELLTNWIEFFTLPQRSEKKLTESGRMNSDLAHKLFARRIQLEEDLHERIEKLGAKGLESLIKGDTDFLYASESRFDFVYYLCNQYLRTKKIENRFLTESEYSPFTAGVNPRAVINAFRHIMSMRMALDLTSPKLEYMVQLVVNETEYNFVTSDQPVINLNCPFPVDNRLPSRNQFYYPVSPRIAIYILNDENRMDKRYSITDSETVIQHNQLIFSASHTQVYAANKSDLDRFL